MRDGRSGVGTAPSCGLEYRLSCPPRFETKKRRSPTSCGSTNRRAERSDSMRSAREPLVCVPAAVDVDVVMPASSHTSHARRQPRFPACMRLYDYGPSANCYKARLLLAQLARPYERVPI